MTKEAPGLKCDGTDVGKARKLAILLSWQKKALPFLHCLRLCCRFCRTFQISRSILNSQVNLSLTKNDEAVDPSQMSQNKYATWWMGFVSVA